MVEIVALVVLTAVVALQSAMIIVLVKRLIDNEAYDPIAKPPTFVEELRALLPGGKATGTVMIEQEVLDYCDLWLDDFAKEDCKLRARRHFADSGDWDVVLTRLGREDGELRG